MTCAEASQRLDAFVDAELPGPELLEVARHAAGCHACDGTVRELLALHDAVAGQLERAAAALDVERVWAGVEARIDATDRRRARVRRLRRVPAWGIAATAMAAGAVLWLRTPELPPPATTTVARARPNHAVIDRIDSDGTRFELRRERKFGTTLIMVSAADTGAMP